MIAKLLSVQLSLVLLVSFLAKLDESSSLKADEPAIEPAKLKWNGLPDLPNELGVAGPFVGVHGGVLIVAGGANFPKPVWDNSKIWLDEVWVLREVNSGMRWVSGNKLPRPLAYGASVSTPEGVICIGGNDMNESYRDVFRLQWDAVLERITIQELPPLPSPCVYGQATLIGNLIYVAGGQSGLKLESAMNNFWSLDLSHRNDPNEFRWRELQSMPTQPRAFNITTCQYDGHEDCVYVIGGRQQVGDGVRFLNDIWKFKPSTQSWRRCTDVPRNLAAGSGIGFGRSEIFVLGGDDGLLFTKTEELKDQHPGFRREALAYNTIIDTWSSAGATPQNQVTTIPVIWNNRMIIANGEVRPRVRTPAIWSVVPIEK